MDKKKDALDPVAERLMDFVNSNGGPSPVAAKMGKHPQLFYNIRDGKSKPSMDTLREVKEAYGNQFSLNWVIMGVSDEEATSKPGAQLNPAPAGDEAYWKKRFEALEKKYDDLLIRYNNLVDMLMTKLNPSFSESDNYTTVYPRTVVGGFQQSNRVEGMRKKARFSPASLVSGPFIAVPARLY